MIDPLRPDRPVGPGVDFLHRADVTVPNHFAEFACAFARVPLVAHLRRHAMLAGCFGEHSRLKNRVCERLLTIDVFTALHRPHRRRGMRMVGGGNDHRVDIVALLVEHLAVVFVLLCVWKFRKGLGGYLPVGIGKGNDVFRRAARNVAVALTAGADGGDVQLLVRGLVAQPLQRRRALRFEPGSRQCGSRSQKKISS